MTTIEDLHEAIREGVGVDVYFESFIAVDHPDGRTDWEFACTQCARILPKPGPGCPDHAPTDVPGLQRAECWDTSGTHNPVWYLAAEDYGTPCPACILAPYIEREEAARQCRHWPWRHWSATRKVLWWVCRSGLLSGTGGHTWGDGHRGCIDPLPRIRGPRQYLLGFRIKAWEPY